MVIRDSATFVAETSWSDLQRNLARPVRIIPTYFLSVKLNDVDLKLYYDKTFGILLRATIIAQDEESNQLDLNFRLVSTNLELVFQENNPFWNTFLRNAILITISSIAGVALLTIGLIKFTKQRVKEKFNTDLELEIEIWK